MTTDPLPAVHLPLRASWRGRQSAERSADAAEQVGGKQLGEPRLGLLHRTGPPGFVDALQQHGHMGWPCTGCGRR